MSELRDAARKLLDAAIHAVHCMNSMRTAPDGVPDGVYTFRLFAAMDALEMTINECGPALSAPDPAGVVEAAVAISQECCHYGPENKCFLERILDDDETACPFDRHICAAVREYEGESKGERTCGVCGSCTDQHFSFFCQAARQWTQPSRSGDCPHWTPREEGNDE
jgi:hypothetical protein